MLNELTNPPNKLIYTPCLPEKLSIEIQSWNKISKRSHASDTVFKKMKQLDELFKDPRLKNCLGTTPKKLQFSQTGSLYTNDIQSLPFFRTLSGNFAIPPNSVFSENDSEQSHSDMLYNLP